MNEVKINVKLDGIDEATEKAERYVKLLEEARTLADELASINFKIITDLKNQNEA